MSALSPFSSPTTIASILEYTQPANDRELLIQLEQDSVPGQATGFRFWLYISDGQLYLRILMSSVFQSIVPRGASDCCPWQRDAKKKWRRASFLREDLIATWRMYESVSALTRASVTNVLREDDDLANKLSRQFMPDDPSFAPRWVAKHLTDLFGRTVVELRHYRYELLPQQLLRITSDAESSRQAAIPSERSVSSFLVASRELDDRK